ncbi:hypothetical protein OIU83_06225 [Flavobacterium sp. LS1R49]|uniref:Uncharacterized protein n=1 Tax=Flavobacterium shii TaxID=2987687 RepID=A0A9X3C4B2_9FLAO|nr:hypothetical protein [Flavobacterium shii]MCV9927239.1 hypothetical protein [Flavobacterium shii]
MQETNMTSDTKPFGLSTEQQEILDIQINLVKNMYTDTESLYTYLKHKYDL